MIWWLPGSAVDLSIPLVLECRRLEGFGGRHVLPPLPPHRSHSGDGGDPEGRALAVEGSALLSSDERPAREGAERIVREPTQVGEQAPALGHVGLLVGAVPSAAVLAHLAPLGGGVDVVDPPVGAPIAASDRGSQEPVDIQVPLARGAGDEESTFGHEDRTILSPPCLHDGLAERLARDVEHMAGVVVSALLLGALAPLVEVELALGLNNGLHHSGEIARADAGVLGLLGLHWKILLGW